MIILLISCIITFNLIIWFNTNSFYEYSKLFRLCKHSKYEYHKEDVNPGDLWIDYISKYYRKYFLVRLITCPICNCTWQSLILCILFSQLLNFFYIFLLSLSMYLVIRKLII